MKKIYTILVCICMLAGFVACEKDKDFVLTTLTVQNETITPSYGSATIDCSFKADATISEAFVQYALSSSFAKYDVAKMTEEKGKYVAQLTDLQDNTTYYIRYAVSNKYSSAVTEEVMEFQTLQCTAPTIALDSIADVWDNRAKAYLHLTFDGGASGTDMGVCWGTQANPTIEDMHKSTKDTVAVLDMTDLQPNTTYYIRAYAVNRVGVSYSEEQEFTTYSLPKVRTEEVADIQENTALLSATLVFDGNDTATIKGFCWSDKANPTIEANHIAVDTASVHYTYLLSELLPATEYHVRAYATNRIGIVYGEEVVFTMPKQVTLPIVVTANAIEVTETSAKVEGFIPDDGNASIMDKGIVYSTNHNPTTNDDKVSLGSGSGAFTCTLLDLQPNTTYYARAYATNSKGTAYGNEVSFTTTLPTENGHVYVDLGLPSGIMWATMNIGAETPEDYGDEFAWGETETKDVYDWTTYKWCEGSSSTLTKYNFRSDCGIIDDKIVLDSEDDAATKNWGGAWRTPTYEEWEELINNTIWEWTLQNDMFGFKIKKRGADVSIFLPVKDVISDRSGYYWSSSLYTLYYPTGAWFTYFNGGNIPNRLYTNGYYFNRTKNMAVRPVKGPCAIESKPTVVLQKITMDTDSSAVAKARIVTDCIERGFVYGGDYVPESIDTDNKIVCGSGKGEISCTLTGLKYSYGNEVCIRAYAINNAGITFSSELKLDNYILP